VSFLAAWAGWVLDGFDFTIFLLAMPDVMKEFDVTSVAAAGSITLTLLFRLAGGVGAGWMADRWGRKLPLMISIVWFALCDGAVAFAPSFTWVLVFRTLFGLGMGAEWTSGATLAMENWPQRSRGIASGVLQGSWAIGFILAAIAYGAIVPSWGWRPLFLVAALPALLVLPIRIWVPESPDWKKAVAARAKVTLADLQAEKVVLRVVWASVLYATSFGVYYGLSGLWPTLLRTVLGVDPGGVRNLVIVFNVGMMAGAITWGTAAAKRGVVLAIVVPLLVLLPALPLYVGAAPGLLWLGALVAGATGAGISGVTPLLLTLLFPPRVRAMSVGIVYHVGALLAAATPTIVAWLSQPGRLPLPTALAGTVAAAALLTVAILLFRPAGALPSSALGDFSSTPGASPAQPQQKA
jgi:SHS family lactate transporter-like MFS transporter